MTANTNTNSLPVLVRPKVAAQILDCHERTVTRMCEAGKLKSCRAGNSWRVNRDSLLEYAGLSTQAAGEVE